MKKTILAVDDAKSILTIIYYFFNEKYEVIKKNNGKEALDWMQQGNIPDVIITDINMPEMGGQEFMEQLQASGFYRHIPVIVLSAMDNSAEKIKFLGLGAHDYVVKPFNPEELELRISNVIRISERALA